MSLWYTSPTETNYNTLNSTVQSRIREMWTMHYPLNAMIDQNKYRVSSKIESVYFGYDDIRLLYGYPATNVSIYHKWTATNDTWPYFDSGKMDYYDIRWRCNKIIHY